MAGERPAVRSRHRVVQLGVRHHQGGQADPVGLGGVHPPAGHADLQGPGVADQLDQALGAAEVGHQAEGHLGHGELGVLGEHPQVAGEGELEAGADGVALHGGDA